MAIDIWHAKLGKKVRVDLTKDVRPHMFKKFAEKIVDHFEKITDPFSVKDAVEVTFSVDQARRVGGIGRWDTTKDYLEIMLENKLLKRVQGPPWPGYIIACTPEEEILATNESIGSQLAGRSYYFIKGLSQRWMLAANIIHYRLSNGPLPWLRRFCNGNSAS